jgi:steroid delta-isomerase-like uncharacterized protein
MADLEARARAWFDTVHARDFDALALMYTPEAEYVRSDGASQGREAIVDYLKGIMGAFPDHASKIDGVLIAKDAITVEWVETATHTEPYGTIAPTGKSFEVRVVEVMRFDGDLIASQHEYYDLLSLLTQLGWM